MIAPAIDYYKATNKYAKLVKEFSGLPDGRGANHASLSRFLGRMISSPQAWQYEDHWQKDNFATAYTFDQKVEVRGIRPAPGRALSSPVTYTSCFEFARETNSEANTSLGRMLFLRGFPSPEWLGIIGSKYKVDSEIFVRFLHFKHAEGAQGNYSLPALPASTWNIIELPVVTIGERKALQSRVSQAEVDAMRNETREKLRLHHGRLHGYDGIATASSVIRDVAVIDHGSFALEQRIWVCLQPTKGNDESTTRWTLIVWTDSGSAASKDSVMRLGILPTAFDSELVSLAPVIDYKPGTGLAARRFTSHEGSNLIGGSETASRLSMGYGRTLYDDVMATDPLYALTEVIFMTTASVNQYLNLLEEKLAGFTDDRHYADFDMLSNLRYTKDVLNRQQRQLEQVAAWLKSHRLQDGTGWRTNPVESPKASQAAISIDQRYEYLQVRVKTLQAQCQDAISSLMNSINLKEVKNSFEQSRRIGKLTFLAFAFAPLSFTTSFFAMNIGLKGLSIKTWFAATLPLLLVTFSLFVFDVSGWILIFWKRLVGLMQNARYL